MRRLAFVLIGLVVLVALIVGGGLLALNTAAARGRIADALSSALGQPVTIGRMKVELLPPALAASGVRIGAADSNAAPGLSLARLRVVPRLSSILPGRSLVVDRVELRGLTIAIRKDKNGRWQLPAAPAPGPTKPGAKPGAPAVTLSNLTLRDGRIRVVNDSLTRPGGGPTVTTISDIAADLQASGGALTVPRFTGKLGGTTVTGSAELGRKGVELHLTSESVQNADLPALFALANMQPYPGLSISGKAPVDITTTIALATKDLAANGRASIEHVKLGTMALDDVAAAFRYGKGRFTLDPFGFGFYGGKEQGSVVMEPGRPPAYTVKSSITGLDVDRALSATTTTKDFLHGTGNIAADVKGSGSTAPAIQRSLAGTVKLDIRNGVLKNFPLLAAVNRAVGITEGSGNDTKFESLTGTATLGGGVARSNDLLLKAGELTMTGTGTMGLVDRSLDMKLRAVLSSAKSQQLVGKLGPVAQLRNAQGELVIPVTVTGTLTQPKYSVDVGAVAKKEVKKQVEQQVQKGLLKLFKKDSS
jgi:uncharacterized protein involved in outer membrane biogenesis